ncbi:hypothetical protein DMUE_5477 [Dictyocoela muelleri]|nr:hypothetical protein DMUE_5477 [Dictyocoela muelleri]
MLDIWESQFVSVEQLNSKVDIVIARSLNRKAITLLPIISREIKDESYVVSDKWVSYNNIQNKHRDTVNHTYNFVDPISKVNTQKIENMWLHLKKIKHYTMV